MKIRKAVKMAVTGTVLALPGLASALDLSSYTYDASDNITAPSLTGMTCSATAGGEAGFLQRQCTDGTDTFIQTIVLENGTEGLFMDNNVVMTGGNNGIADYNIINDPTTGFHQGMKKQTGVFGASDALNLGVDALGNNWRMVLSQAVTDTSGANETMSSSFGFAEDTADFQVIGISQALNNTTAGEEFSQSFDHAELTAAQDGSTSTGSTFAAGDYVTTSLINQDVVGVGLFSLQDFADETTGLGTGVDSLVSAGPHYVITYTDTTPVFASPLYPDP